MELDAATLSTRDAYALLTTVVAPRPIGWIATLDGAHVNLAPFSYFNALCSDPPMVTVAIADGRAGAPKDTLRLLCKSGAFVCNLVEAHDLARMNATSAELPPDVSEATHVGIETVPFAGAVRVTSSRVALGCRVVDEHRYGRQKKITLIVAEVTAVWVADELVTSTVADGSLAINGGLLNPVARLEGAFYGLDFRRVALPRP